MQPINLDPLNKPIDNLYIENRPNEDVPNPLEKEVKKIKKIRKNSASIEKSISTRTERDRKSKSTSKELRRLSMKKTQSDSKVKFNKLFSLGSKKSSVENKGRVLIRRKTAMPSIKQEQVQYNTINSVSSEINEDDYFLKINELNLAYSIELDNCSKEQKVIIDICEGVLDAYILENRNESSEKIVYENFHLGFLHCMDPKASVSFINEILNLDLQREKKNTLYKFVQKLFKATLKFNGDRYAEWVEAFGEINDNRFQKLYQRYRFNQYRPEKISLFEASLLNEPDYLLPFINYKKKKCIVAFSEFLSEAIDYYLSYISDNEIIDFGGIGKIKLKIIGDFSEDYLFYIWQKLMQDDVESIDEKFQIHQKYIIFLYKCLIYVTKNNMQHLGFMLYAFLNNYITCAVSSRIKSNTLTRLVTKYQDFINKNYSPQLYNKDLFSNSESRWPLYILIGRISRWSEKQPIEASLEDCLELSNFRLIHMGSIESLGSLVHLFRNRVQNIQEYINEDIYEVNFNGVESFKGDLENIYCG